MSDEDDEIVEGVARYVEGDGSDSQRLALADGVRARRWKPAAKSEWKCAGKSITDSDTDIYFLEDQRTTELIDLDGGNAWLAVHVDHLIVSFAVFDFFYGPSTPTRTPDDTRTAYQMLLHGSGPSGSLRECRHIWWGERGYTHYLKFSVIEAAFRHLRRWFDGD